MNDFVAGVVSLLLRVIVIAMGLVLFASLLVAAMLLALVWALRAGWARLTGRPVTPWVMGVDPRTGFSTVFRTTERWSAGRRGSSAHGNALYQEKLISQVKGSRHRSRNRQTPPANFPAPAPPPLATRLTGHDLQPQTEEA